jgi:hypothetical protein
MTDEAAGEHPSEHPRHHDSIVIVNWQPVGNINVVFVSLLFQYVMNIDIESVE